MTDVTFEYWINSEYIEDPRYWVHPGKCQLAATLEGRELVQRMDGHNPHSTCRFCGKPFVGNIKKVEG